MLGPFAWDKSCAHRAHAAMPRLAILPTLRVLGRIEANRGGIVLFHNTKRHTAAMLATLLRALKSRDYRVVHVVAGANSAQ